MYHIIICRVIRRCVVYGIGIAGDSDFEEKTYDCVIIHNVIVWLYHCIIYTYIHLHIFHYVYVLYVIIIIVVVVVVVITFIIISSISSLSGEDGRARLRDPRLRLHHQPEGRVGDAIHMCVCIYNRHLGLINAPPPYLCFSSKRPFSLLFLLSKRPEIYKIMAKTLLIRREIPAAPSWGPSWGSSIFSQTRPPKKWSVVHIKY